MKQFAGKMVRVFLLAAISTVLLAGFASAAETQQAISVGATTGSSLRLRADASTSSSVITMLDEGVAVAVLDDSIDGWYKINYDGDVGYVSADYMVIDQDNVFTASGRVTGDGVYVRSSPSTDSDVLNTVDADTIVTINGFVDGWNDVTCKYGTEGYIRSDFLADRVAAEYLEELGPENQAPLPGYDQVWTAPEALRYANGNTADLWLLRRGSVIIRLETTPGLLEEQDLDNILTQLEGGA